MVTDGTGMILLANSDSHFSAPKSTNIMGHLFHRGANWSHRFILIITRHSLSWAASAKSGILPMKLITLITKCGSLNPLTQMFYSIFIKKS
jgi:hypothetical protein